MTDITLALLIDRFMRRIHMSLQARASAFDTENVGPAGGMILLLIADTGPIQMQDLARQAARDKSQMTRLAQSLQKKGLIARSPAPRDARASVVSLTDKGWRVVHTLRAALAQAIDDILGPLAPEDRRILADTLSRALNRT